MRSEWEAENCVNRTKKLISYDMLWFKVHVYFFSLYYDIYSLIFCKSRKSHSRSAIDKN